VPRGSIRIIVFVAVVAAIVILIFVSGWADDNAQPGSTGRVTVTRQDTNATP
jgi:hypothetical protein